MTAAGKDAGTTLLILPVYDQVEAELMRRALSEGGATFGGNIATFSQLIDDVAAAALREPPPDAWWRHRRFATAAELAVLRRQVTEDARAHTSGQPDGSMAVLLRGRGFTRLLAGAIEACAEGAVEPAELTAFAADAGTDAQRVALVAQLYTAYRRLLANERLLDPSDRLRIAHHALGADLPMRARRLEGVERVEVRGQYDWSALRLSILIRLAERLRETLGPPDRLTLFIPYSHRGRHLFHYLEASLRELERRHDAPLTVVFETIEDQTDSPPARVASNLFNDGRSDVPDGAVRLSAGPGRAQELRSVARRIRNLVEAGTPPDRIAIGLRQVQQDWEPVARALEAYGVAWHYRRGATLADTPLFGFVVELLTAAIEGLPRAVLERVISSAYTPAPGRRTTAGSVGGPEIETDDLIAVLRAAGARDLETGRAGHRDGYQVRLERFIERERHELAARGGTKRGEERLARLTAAAEAVLVRVGLLESLRQARSCSQWAATLASLLTRPELSPLDHLTRHSLLDPEADTPDRLDTASTRALALDQQSWRALQQALSELARAPGAERLELTAAGARSLLIEVSRDVSLNPTGTRGAAVRIVPVRQLVGADVDVVFLPHLNEGQFPRPPQLDPLLRDGDRLAFDRWRRQKAHGRPVLRAFRIEEPQPDDDRVPVRRSEEVVLFCLALAAARRRAFLSWSTIDDRGRPQLPSLFVEGLRRMRLAGSQQPVGAESEPLSVLPPLDQVVEAGELSRLCLSRARVGLQRARDEAWMSAARTLLGRSRAATIERRARIELARRRFFDGVAVGESLRSGPPAWCPDDLAPYLGCLSDPLLGSWFGANRFGFDADHPLSASQADLYGHCPARFFVARVLGLDAEDEAQEQADALSRGRILHGAMERLYPALNEVGLSIEAIQGPGGWAVEAVVRACVDAALDEVATRQHLGHPRLVEVERRGLGDLLIRALRRATNPRRRGDYLPLDAPWRVEWSFGRRGNPPVTVTLGQELGRAHISGRIDRVDRLDDGSLWLTDYKSGRVAPYGDKLSDDRLHRSEFQLSLYAVAARQHLTPTPDTPVAVQYFSLKEGLSRRLDWEVLAPRLGAALQQKPPSENGSGPEDRSFVTLSQGLSNVVRGMRDGVFTAATRGCAFCDFAQVCRVSRAVFERDS